MSRSSVLTCGMITCLFCLYNTGIPAFELPEKLRTQTEVRKEQAPVVSPELAALSQDELKAREKELMDEMKSLMERSRQQMERSRDISKQIRDVMNEQQTVLQLADPDRRRLEFSVLSLRSSLLFETQQMQHQERKYLFARQKMLMETMRAMNDARMAKFKGDQARRLLARPQPNVAK